jgi:hypothetical protein
MKRNEIFYTTRSPRAGEAGVKGKASPIALPPHLFTPPGCQTIDIAFATQRTGVFDDVNFLSFTCPAGGVAQILGYAIYTTITDYTKIEFTPFQNNSRVFPFHGNPADSFRIRFSPSLTLGNDSIRNTQLTLKPGEILRWRVNGDAGATAQDVGVRVIGFYTTEVENLTERFGG